MQFLFWVRYVIWRLGGIELTTNSVSCHHNNNGTLKCLRCDMQRRTLYTVNTHMGSLTLRATGTNERQFIAKQIYAKVQHLWGVVYNVHVVYILTAYKKYVQWKLSFHFRIDASQPFMYGVCFNRKMLQFGTGSENSCFTISFEIFFIILNSMDW